MQGVQDVQGRWEEWKVVRQVLEAKVREQEVKDRWMEVFESEQKTGQTQ